MKTDKELSKICSFEMMATTSLLCSYEVRDANHLLHYQNLFLAKA
jgi:hypothetical protein